MQNVLKTLSIIVFPYILISSPSVSSGESGGEILKYLQDFDSVYRSGFTISGTYRRDYLEKKWKNPQNIFAPPGGPILSTPLFAGFAKHFIEAGSARLADEQFPFIGRQVRHRVLNIFSGHPLMHIGHVHQ